ncbi:MAG: PilW family protein [Sutterellaceae bacterium]|nr:PilW family protein [Burkholderiaceae bacterium]MCX7900704.1 PilW family protein [Burkholderiaceae bacterium]MDW8429721.1 PilW family protein [Sutterellaceae bacterium]
MPATVYMPHRRAQRGLTLVEAMVSITIGLIVVGALTYLFVGARTTYRVNDELARVQEAGRFALDYIAQDLRMTSFAGCRSRSLGPDNFLNVTRPAVAFNGSGDGIVGFEDGNGWTNSTGVARAAGDVIVVRRAVGLVVRVLGNSDPVARRVTIEHNAMRLSNGDLALVADCQRALLFRVTNNPPPTGVGHFPTVLEYAELGAGPGGTDGNLAVISGPIGNEAFREDARAQAMRLVETAYFVGTNAAGRRALYRAVGSTAEELVDGIEDIEILYGVDTDLDGIANAYQRADAVADWSHVVAVRVSLLAVGTDATVATAAQTFALRDTSGDGIVDAQTAPDRRLRQVFTTTVALRNRML